MTIYFELCFRSCWGERLFISGNVPELGGDDLANALPMTWKDEGRWQASVDINVDKNQPLHYHYILRDETADTCLGEGEKSRQVILTPGRHTLHLHDRWNDPSEIGNVFFSAPFDILLKRDTPRIHSSRKKQYEFRVKAPLTEPGETICLLRYDEAESPVGNPLLLHVCRRGEWCINTTLFEMRNTRYYQYGVYDMVSQCLIMGEEGAKRMFSACKEKDHYTIVSDEFAHFPMKDWRAAGISVPVFCLRSNESFGIGEFMDLKKLADWASLAGFHLLQLLPVNDTTATHTWRDSYPYAAISSFALHPAYIRLQAIGKLADDHPLQKRFWKLREQLEAAEEVDYEVVLRFKWQYIRALFAEQYSSFIRDKGFREFLEDNGYWLKPYAAFCYLRDQNETADFNRWETHFHYDETAISDLVDPGKAHYKEIAVHYFVQYHLHLQLNEVAHYAHGKRVVLKGDIPIGIYRYSVDAWMQPELFNMNMQAGAPPDDFAEKGQNWGFPTYNWHRMEADGFRWWKQRFQQMAYYFDAFRIDHILGFFRIWQIPCNMTEGIMGNFEPVLPLRREEFSRHGIVFDTARFCKPYITEELLELLFKEHKAWVTAHCLEQLPGDLFSLKKGWRTQYDIERSLEREKIPGVLQHGLRSGLFSLVSNVLLLEAEGSGGMLFHPRYGMQHTYSFRQLDPVIQWQLKELYDDYFYRRQDSFWRRQALHKLPALKQGTQMMVCGEDLGMVPHCVPGVMRKLGILSLEVQRMPKQMGNEFFHPAEAPYLSVVSPGTHDMSTLRGWWEEDRQRSQRFYNGILEEAGDAPWFCEPWIVQKIVAQHLRSSAMWAIFQLQDLLAMNARLRRENPHEERINIPANAQHYWRYRMHLKLEELQEEKIFTDDLQNMILAAGRKG